jgi:hypothetical protein
MSSLKKNLIMEGVFASQAIDSSGEVLDIRGADISDLTAGKSLVNLEHQNPEDFEKNKSAKKDEPKGFDTIIGRVLTAKKIFDEDDCSTDKELDSFKKNGKIPLIYGKVEIYDGDDAPDNSRAAAALIRMFDQDPDGPQFGLSVEGSTLKRENGNILKETCIRRLAGTLKPCNKQAWIHISSDNTNGSNSSRVNKSEYRASMDVNEPLYKSVSMQQIFVEKTFNDFGLSNALSDLKKALTAGGQDAAPSSLTGGSALQKESNLAKLARKMAKTSLTEDSVKKAVPTLTDENAKKVLKALKKHLFDRTLETCEKIYKSIN